MTANLGGRRRSEVRSLGLRAQGTEQRRTQKERNRGDEGSISSGQPPAARRTYSHGSVVHLDIRRGEIEATVSGSELYQVRISIAAAARARWKSFAANAPGASGPAGRTVARAISEHVMDIITRKRPDCFPRGRDQAQVFLPRLGDHVKHVAAALYGVGARWIKPELLFTLRSVITRN